MRYKPASALLIALLLPACAGNATPLPGTTKLLDELPRVANSTAAPCRMQREVASQNSYLATIKEQREVIYKAPCDIDPKPAARVASAKTEPSR